MSYKHRIIVTIDTRHDDLANAIVEDLLTRRYHWKDVSKWLIKDVKIAEDDFDDCV